jgi:hypothetical protein
VKLRKLLPGAAASEAQPRRRRAPRADGPRTIVPVDDETATPSWLHRRPSTTMSLDLDAARERLRRAIPPVADDE